MPNRELKLKQASAVLGVPPRICRLRAVGVYYVLGAWARCTAAVIMASFVYTRP